MTDKRLISIQTGTPREVQLPDGSRMRTSIYKSEVADQVWLGFEDLEGNRQADHRYHGGPDKAVCCYAAEHYEAVRRFVGKEMGYGAFGENFTLRGMLETEVCLGDRYRVADAVVEISQPRQPCSNLAKRWQCTQLPKFIQQNGFTGWYLRVIEEGFVEPGVELQLLERPYPKWTISELNRVKYQDRDDLDSLEELVQLEQLSADWRKSFRKVLRDLKSGHPAQE